MTDDEFRARWEALDAELLLALQQTRAALRRLRDIGDHDDASGAVGVRAPVSPRRPRPRIDAIAEEMAQEILTPEFREEMRQLIRRALK